jgi:aerobic carbon-monoxide dehydrogenase large subunit
MPMERVHLLHGSTPYLSDGFGSYHSRSTVMGGSAILLAAEALHAKIRAAAAERLGCAASEIELADGDARGPGGRSVSVATLAEREIWVEERFANHRHTYAYGTMAAHVAVDGKTGQVELVDLLMVEDVGKIVNPMTLKGQAIGSMVQGLGGAFLEHLVYDDEGQLLTGSFADYLLPTASDFPKLDSITLELKPCPNNPLGAKGAGEGALIPVGGLMANAIADALSHLNVQPMELPLSPPKIWQLVEDAEAARAKA